MNNELPASFHNRHHNSEVFIGPHTKLTGLDGAATIDSHSLAGEFAKALIPICLRRYGKGVDLHVIECRGRLTKNELDKMISHSRIIRNRLVTNNFVPNKKVIDTED